jgi:hypothetical protein
MKILNTGVLLLFLGISTVSFGQTTDFRAPQDSWSLGYSLIHELLPEGITYRPVTFLSNHPIWQIKRLTIYAESQFTEAYSPISMRTDFELGVNMGFSFFFIQTDRLSLNAAIGSGPHYITVETGRQAKGFIFSDNFELGTAYNIKSINTTFLLKFRYRHISNAGLKEPNGGIDNFFVITGLSANW